MKCEGVIHSDPAILVGTTVFVGPRVSVESLFDHLESGHSIGDFSKDSPSCGERGIAVLEKVRMEFLIPA
jgi:uncharacterized protein (DUF433 family)